MNIAGRVALVTGANRGIGAAIVDALVAAGIGRVYAAARSPAAVAVGRVVPIALDITDAELVARAAREHADVEILINNAGVLGGQRLLAAADPAAAELEMRTNFFGTLAMCRAFAPVLAGNGGGAIVNVLSILARVPFPEVGSYAASKAATFSLTQAIRGELAAHKTLVVAIMPAFVDTDMTRRLPMPKLSPAAVAESIVDALRRDVEDVYPGPAAALAAELQSDPKAVERRFATMLARPGDA